MKWRRGGILRTGGYETPMFTCTCLIPVLFAWIEPDEQRRRARYLSDPAARPGDGWDIGPQPQPGRRFKL